MRQPAVVTKRPASIPADTQPPAAMSALLCTQPLVHCASAARPVARPSSSAPRPVGAAAAAPRRSLRARSSSEGGGAPAAAAPPAAAAKLYEELDVVLDNYRRAPPSVKQEEAGNVKTAVQKLADVGALKKWGIAAVDPPARRNVMQGARCRLRVPRGCQLPLLCAAHSGRWLAACRGRLCACRTPRQQPARLPN